MRRRLSLKSGPALLITLPFNEVLGIYQQVIKNQVLIIVTPKYIVATFIYLFKGICFANQAQAPHLAKLSALTTRLRYLFWYSFQRRVRVLLVIDHYCYTAISLVQSPRQSPHLVRQQASLTGEGANISFRADSDCAPWHPVAAPPSVLTSYLYL